MDKKFVYDFNEGSKEMKSLLGGKGANLAEMTSLDLPVPPGFTISTEACIRFDQEKQQLWSGLKTEIEEHLTKIEQKTGKRFSDEENPMLLSVRSGAVDSMPGMMDTILNLGLNDRSAKGLAKATGNERFAYDSYRRFIEMFSDVAMGIPKVRFDSLLEQKKSEKGADQDTDLDVDDLRMLTIEYKEVYREEIGEAFPQDPMKQLYYAIAAVFSSWNNPRAVVYRKLHNISNLLGTAVNVQAMVFGNMGDTSGTGVFFTRNPANGENKLYGEFLLNAQGEDVVAGVRTPKDISVLKSQMPEMYEELEHTAQILEEHYRDMQDIEFTIENNQLYFLQTRNGKRTAHAAVNIVVDLYKENTISKEEGIMRIQSKHLEQLLHPAFEETAVEKAEAIAKGLGASPGAATGAIYFTAEDVEEAHANGIKTILVRQETSPEDISGMVKAEGILTARGGMTSHAAVVARGMGKCCIAGCTDIRVNEAEKKISLKSGTLKEGDIISIDGTTGIVYTGEISKIEPKLSGKFGEFMEWVNAVKRMAVRANADTPKDAKQALKFGAEGIGLVRTEHMFFAEDRIPAVRRMILSDTTEEREMALEKLLPMQKDDFYYIYQTMADKPVTIRLLDPPLHEFLPVKEKDIRNLASSMDISYESLKERILKLQESNPMLGHRGVRLAVTYPEIARMQTRAIIEAALEIKRNTGITVAPELMVPLIGDRKELDFVKQEMEAVIKEIFREKEDTVPYQIGTMIEVPRAALVADEIAESADFFSFGTNDLTQMGYGFSRDDAGSFIPEYLDKELLKHDPFDSIDQQGIGRLVKLASESARTVKPDLKLGVCGEHGGDPESIEFFESVGLNYVSCSPYRVPIARLAAAQATLKHKREKTAPKKDPVEMDSVKIR